MSFIGNLKLKRRAIARLAAMHFYGNPSAKLKIVGITGTNGKTTTAELLYKVALGLGYKAGFIGTTRIMINSEEFKMDRKIPTTPDPLTLNKIFTEMVKKECQYVFMEVSSHAMDQDRVAGINFTGGIFTNLTQDHLDYHKNMENYFLAKKKFFQMLSPSAFALTNLDDTHGMLMLDGIKAKKYSYGFENPSDSLGQAPDFIGEIKKIYFDGLELTFNSEYLNSKLLGKFNAYNLLAVWSACVLLGFDMKKVKEIIKIIEPPEGRFDHFISGNGILGIVDYAHSPDSLEKVLNTIKEIKKPEAKIISVFGCGGDRDPLKRRIMGKIGVQLSDFTILTSDNPRNEDSEKILAEMKVDLTMQDLEKTKTIADRRDAIKEAVKLIRPGDIILLAGKGHEKYQEIRGVKYPFSDMEELKKILK